MSQDIQIQTIEKILAPLLVDDVFLVSIKIKPTNNIKIFLDADNGLSIEKCIKINRALYKIIEETSVYPDGDFSLEVSSPGVGEPLQLLRQYKKNIGRNIELLLNNEEIIEGKLIAATDDIITIQVVKGKGKKTTIEDIDTNCTDIKQAKVQIKF